MPGRRAKVKNENQYEALKKKGMSKERAAKIADSPDTSKHGGKKSGSGRQRKARRNHRAEEGGRPQGRQGYGSQTVEVGVSKRVGVGMGIIQPSGRSTRPVDTDGDPAPPVSIRIYPDGPLMVRGDVALSDESGQSIRSDRQVLSLCRCGKSTRAPLCDGSHARRRRAKG
jgi:hypothetical protein